MIVIADTSPINYLVLIGQRERTPEVVRRWLAGAPGWLEIVAPKQAPDAELIKTDLDPGERDAILPAQELAADELIIDDMDGRREARRRRLPFIGTLGVLRLAGNRGLLDFKKAIVQLQNTTFYVEPKLLDRLIRGEEA